MRPPPKAGMDQWPSLEERRVVDWLDARTQKAADLIHERWEKGAAPTENIRDIHLFPESYLDPNLKIFNALDPDVRDWWAYHTVNTGLSMVPMIGASTITGSTRVGLAIAGMQEASGIARTAQERGETDTEQLIKYLWFAAHVAVTQKIPLDELLAPIKTTGLKDVTRGAMRRFLAEGLQEWQEEPTQEFIDNVNQVLKGDVSVEEAVDRIGKATREGADVMLHAGAPAGLMAIPSSMVRTPGAWKDDLLDPEADLVEWLHSDPANLLALGLSELPTRKEFENLAELGVLQRQRWSKKERWLFRERLKQAEEEIGEMMTGLEAEGGPGLIVPEGMTMPEMALRFILGETIVSTIIPGMRKTGHVRMNLSASDAGPLDPALMKELEAHRWDRKPTSWSQ